MEKRASGYMSKSELKERLATSEALLKRTISALREAGEINQYLQQQLEVAKNYIGNLLLQNGTEKATISMDQINWFNQHKETVLFKSQDKEAIIIQVIDREEKPDAAQVHGTDAGSAESDHDSPAGASGDGRGAGSEVQSNPGDAGLSGGGGLDVRGEDAAAGVPENDGKDLPEAGEGESAGVSAGPCKLH
jgi:hypothetical protein